MKYFLQETDRLGISDLSDKEYEELVKKALEKHKLQM